MSQERVVCVTLPVDADRQLLLHDIASASARAKKADPGDRVDVVRFEALMSQLEAWAFQNLSRASDLVELSPSTPTHDVSAVEQGENSDGASIMVTLRLPLEPGLPLTSRGKTVARPPAERWKSPTGAKGRDAVEERFGAQLEAALRAADAGKDPTPISPSGIQNPVVTETLRTFVAASGRLKAVPVPLEYRDGSRSQHDFQLRSLALVDQVTGRFDLELRFALISIRHTEMDPVVDGAWLRNAEISRDRPAAQTDDFAYSISREQLDVLTDNGRRRVKIYMYQTGLETAVVGFYKALTDHLLSPGRAGSVAVIPMYFQSAPRARAAAVVERAPFEPGKPWALKPRGK